MVKISKNIIRINLKRKVDDSYDFVFGKNLFPMIAKDMKKLKLRCAIITDSNIQPLFGNLLKKELKKQNLNPEIFCFKAGERSKNINVCMKIIDNMSRLKYKRDSIVLALGGGVVGDLAGFVAAIFNRGIPYIHIPTTILAQADSSIGGKTALDTKYGKNLIGAFKQPLKVYIDINIVKNLPEKPFITGLAEIIKHGIIQDKKFFNYLEKNANNILKRDFNTLLYIIKQNCKIKGRIIEKDLYEKNIRIIVNYGHTIGHAIEKLSNYKLSHGEAISIGMMAAGRIAIKLKTGFNEKDLKSQENLILKFGLPTKIPKNISNKDIIEVTTRDKKGKANYCLPSGIGKMCKFNKKYTTQVNKEIILKSLNKTR